jgi:hypothetical protein
MSFAIVEQVFVSWYANLRSYPFNGANNTGDGTSRGAANTPFSNIHNAPAAPGVGALPSARQVRQASRNLCLIIHIVLTHAYARGARSAPCSHCARLTPLGRCSAAPPHNSRQRPHAGTLDRAPINTTQQLLQRWRMLQTRASGGKARVLVLSVRILINVLCTWLSLSAQLSGNIMRPAAHMATGGVASLTYSETRVLPVHVWAQILQDVYFSNKMSPLAPGNINQVSTALLPAVFCFCFVSG